MAQCYGVHVVVAAVASALLNRWLAQKAERRNPPLGRFITMDGIRLHYVDRGTGTPLVLLHGNGSMIEDFQSSGWGLPYPPAPLIRGMRGGRALQLLVQLRRMAKRACGTSERATGARRYLYARVRPPSPPIERAPS